MESKGYTQILSYLKIYEMLDGKPDLTRLQLWVWTVTFVFLDLMSEGGTLKGDMCCSFFSDPDCEDLTESY